MIGDNTVIELYTCQRADGGAVDVLTSKREEASEYARRHGLRVVMRTYEVADEEVVEDHTTSHTPREKKEGGDHAVKAA